MSLNQIRLAHIALHLATGGLERLVVEFARASKRFFPIVICLKEKGELAVELEDSGIRVTALGKRDGFDIKLFLKLASVLHREKIKIVHTHNFAAYLYGAIAAKLAGVPIIIHTEHGIHRHSQIRRRLLAKIISLLVNRIIAVSDEVKSVICYYNHVNRNRVVTIPNGIDVGKYSHRESLAAKKKEFGICDGVYVIGNVARLSPEKDHKTLLGAFSLVLNEFQSVKLVIAGNGVLRNELEAKAQEMGIQDKVMFLGLRNDVPDLLSIFDLFVLSSIREGIPLTILEAMAAELPVVATNVGGVPEVVVNGETGFVVRARNPHRLASAIISVLSDRDMARQMGLQGRKRVAENFSIDRTNKMYEELYVSLLGRGMGGG